MYFCSICGHPEQHEDRTLRTRSKLPGTNTTKRTSEFVESLVRAKKNIGFTAPTLELPSGYNDNTSFRNNSSPINPATIAAQALSNSSFTRHSDSTDIESYKTTLISKLNEITRKESTIPWGGAEIPVPNIKIDHSVKISEFVGIVKEIDSEFQNHLSALERERKDRIVVQENRITKEVKDQIRKLKGYAVQDFIKSLGSYVMPGDSNDVNGPVPSPSLADDSQSDVLILVISAQSVKIPLFEP